MDLVGNKRFSLSQSSIVLWQSGNLEGGREKWRGVLRGVSPPGTGPRTLGRHGVSVWLSWCPCHILINGNTWFCPYQGLCLFLGFPDGSDSICLQCGRPEFDPWVRNIPWRREWQPSPVFLPGEFHGQRNGGLRSIGSQRVRYNWGTNKVCSCGAYHVVIHTQNPKLKRRKALHSKGNLNVRIVLFRQETFRHENIYSDDRISLNFTS